ncbi:MAG: AEC family transporter [Chloroflexi bacterium]|jgi:predicted permease|nr:AEC family transporter [Chloroflexota bacterium]
MAIVEIIFPVFAIALLGYIVAYKGLFTVRDIQGISRFVFIIAIPVMLFNSLAHIDLPEHLNWQFLVSYYAIALFIFGLGMWASKSWFAHSAQEQSVFGLGSSYSNSVLVGLPLVSAGLGDEALLPTFMLIAIHSALLFFMVTLFAERDGGNGRSPLAIGRQTLVNLATNPIIIGLALGLLVNLFNIPIPTLIDSTIGIISRAALPCALFVLGASLSAYKISGHFAEAWTMVGLKLLLQPLLVWVLAFVVFKIDPLWGAVAVMMAGMPVGINVYMFAQKYQVGLASVSGAIVISTTLAVLSQSILLAIFI